jgi:formylglycine-generating enzyme required for sulfatase activity
MVLAVVFISAATHSGRADDKTGRLTKDAPPPLIAPFDETKAKAAQESWAKHLGKSSPLEKNSIGMEMVLIPAGNFRMGSPATEEDRWSNEDQVDVTLTKSFYLSKTEVTQGQWRAMMGTTPWQGEKYVKEGDNYAATNVSWDDAQAFCQKLREKENGKYRLPTEAEWEYACRGGTTTRFSVGDDESALSSSAWWGGLYGDGGNAENEQYAHQVGRKQANAFGLYDMHGNVYEWCEDMYAEKLRGGTNPLVSSGGSNRALRGGCWDDVAVFCRSGNRNWGRPGLRRISLGFRPALSYGQ